MRSKQTVHKAARPRTKTAAAKRAQIREKVAAYRVRMRKQGLRPIQLWVPDVNSPEFIAEARRQARLIASSPHEEEDQAFIDAISAGLHD